jgi:predicted MFS family arabinose efflux permease
MVWVLAVSCAIVIANNYYNQPLLADFARTFHVSERAAGVAAMATQIGYALGMLILLPLGDMVDRRVLINLLLLASTVALLAIAVAPGLDWLIAASFAVGFTSVVPQVIVPFSAHLAPPEARGRVVGIVMGGLLAGILLSRTVAGFVSARFGWPTMYWLAACLMVLLMLVLSVLLPRDKPTFRGSYGSLLRSLGTLMREQPVLRETSLVAALQFGAFSAFWTTLAFHLDAMPEHYDSSIAGLFGVIGLVGVLAAPLAGKLSDRGSPRLTVLVSSLVVAASYAAFAAGGHSIAGLVLGVILLDLGIQSGHVSNMSRNYALKADAMSRLNTVYMVTRFLGGALGAAAGNYAWSVQHWAGVCAVGFVLSLAAIAVQFVPWLSSAERVPSS